MENENPYTHIKDFEEVCHTSQKGIASIDIMRLKLFPFTLKDKNKVWLNSLRTQSIHSWTKLQAEFFKKFFPAHCTSGLRKFPILWLWRMEFFLLVGRDIWRLSMLVLIMVLTLGCQ